MRCMASSTVIASWQKGVWCQQSNCLPYSAVMQGEQARFSWKTKVVVADGAVKHRCLRPEKRHDTGLGGDGQMHLA